MHVTAEGYRAIIFSSSSPLAYSDRVMKRGERLECRYPSLPSNREVKFEGHIRRKEWRTEIFPMGLTLEFFSDPKHFPCAHKTMPSFAMLPYLIDLLVSTDNHLTALYVRNRIIRGESLKLRTPLDSLVTNVFHDHRPPSETGSELALCRISV